MRVVMVGAGNLATHLASALCEAGYDVCQVFSRTMESARMLAEHLRRFAVVEPASDYSKLIRDADLYVVSVCDSALQSVIDTLSEIVSQESVCVHTAGSMPMELFKGKLAHYGVLYPMQTFSKVKSVDFKEIPVFLEASDESAMSLIKSVADNLSPKVYMADGIQRRVLHLSAVFCCNFVNHCYAISSELLKEHGLVFDVMFPLIEETADKIHKVDPVLAQTGPAVRGDRNVMDKHMELLSDYAGWKNIYATLSESINELKKKSDDKL